MERLVKIEKSSINVPSSMGIKSFIFFTTMSNL